MVQFIIFAGMILVAGPGHNEGGFKAIEQKGFKPAVEKAWEDREAYDSGTLKGTLGNYGND